MASSRTSGDSRPSSWTPGCPASDTCADRSEGGNALAQPLLNSPLRWVGGKSRLRRQIIPHFPEHRCYVEPFCGAAWVLFGKTASAVEVLNDLDGELVNFFTVVRERPEALIAAFDLELVSRRRFHDLAALDPAELDPVARAHRFYYLIMAGWGGEGAYPRFQTSVSDAGHGNRLIGAIRSLRRRLEPVHRRLATVIIENLDWRECLERYDRAGDRVFMYLDPPYPENGANYRHNMRGWDQHRELAERLATLRCRWMLSSPDRPEVRELHHGRRLVTVQTSSGMRSAAASTEGDGEQRTLNRELLVMNY